MEKRYQVFVSSTYADLRDERRRVIQTLMEMDCIPSGMELFPAADEEQWAFIRRVIDDCDYYLLIIGNRYGSTTPEGVSYTEKEYDYAFEKGLKVIALLHEAPDDLPVVKSDIDPTLRGRLQAFRDKVGSGRLVKFWKTADELPGLVALSLSKTIKTHPAVGWIRADQASNATVLAELNEVRKEAERLRKSLAEYQGSRPTVITDLAGLDETIKLSGHHYLGGDQNPWAITLTWQQVFALLAPSLQEHPSDDVAQKLMATALSDRVRRGGTHPSMDDQQFQTVRIQLSALGLVTASYTKSIGGGMALFWSLTPKGEALLFESRTVRTSKATK